MLKRGWLIGWTVLAVVSASSVPASSAKAEAPPVRLIPSLALAIDAMPLAQVQENRVSEPQPSTGVGLIVVGWIAVGVAALNLATLPICYADFYPRESEDLCVGLSLVVAGVGVSLGIPFLIVGYVNRSNYNDWKERNDVARHLSNTQLALREDGALLSYRGEL